MWDKVFENGPSKICGRQILKNLKEYGVLKIHITISNTETSSTRRNIYSPVDLFVLPSKKLPLWSSFVIDCKTFVTSAID